MLEILNILKQYGWTGLALGLILFIVYKLATEWSKDLFENIKLKLAEKRQENLSMHTFFNTINYVLNVELHALNVFQNKPVRQALTKDLIFCSLASMYEIAEKIVKADQSNWSKAEWRFQMLNHLNDMNTSFLNMCHAKGIPQQVYMKYLDWYFERVVRLRQMVDQIENSAQTPTPESKTSTLLLLFSLFITTMMGDCESAMNELNGEITGLVYKGGIIEPLDH